MTVTNFVYNQNTQYLFNRAYAVSIAPPGQTQSFQYGTLGLKPAPLRVRFDIDKNGVGSSNKAKIEIFNLSDQTRQQLKSGWSILLEAGYNGLTGIIFFGDISLEGTTSTRNGPDIITAIMCGDGEAAIGFSTIDKNYPAGTTLAIVLQDIGTAMNTKTNTSPIGLNAGVGIGIPNVVFQRGLTLHGSCADALNKLLPPNGLKWNVDNGNLNILPVNSTNGNTAIVVSSNTGMIGVPSQNKNFMTFTSLLNPKLVPGALIQLVSQNTSLNGFYTINRAHYEGDSHDNKWQVECECVQANDVAQSLPAAQGFNYNTAVVS